MAAGQRSNAKCLNPRWHGPCSRIWLTVLGAEERNTSVWAKTTPRPTKRAGRSDFVPDLLHEGVCITDTDGKLARLMTAFGYDPSHSIVKASGDGLQTVLFKPFKIQILYEQISRALGIEMQLPTGDPSAG